MSFLADLLHTHKSDLELYAHRLAACFTDLSLEADIKQIYTVKWRIKSYESIRSKLIKYHRSDRLHNDPSLTMPRLMTYVEDIVGLRVVCLFQNDVNVVANRLFYQRGPTRTIEILDKETATPRLYRYFLYKPLSQIDVTDASWKSATERDTGYSSVHAIVRFTDKSRMYERYGQYRAEVQIRSVLEEAWSETSHYLSYKKATTDRTVNDLKLAAASINELNNRLQVIADHALDYQAANSFKFRLQLAKDYRFDPSDHITGELVERLTEAHALREEHKHSEALDIHRNYTKPAELMKVVPGPEVGRVRLVMLCEMALDLLFLGEVKNAQKARDLYIDVLKEDPDHFWATFRLSFIEHRFKNYDDAIRLAERAAQLFLTQSKDKSSELNRWWDIDGLLLDVHAELGRRYWAKADAEFRRAYGTTGDVNPASKAAAEALLQCAINKTEQAFSDKGERGNSVNDDQHNRCANNLAFFYGQLNRFEEALVYLNLVKPTTRQSHPFILDTEAWIEFRRPGGNREVALEVAEKAMDYLRLGESAHSASRELVDSVQVHHQIIRRHVREHAHYTEGDEYWTA